MNHDNCYNYACILQIGVLVHKLIKTNAFHGRLTGRHPIVRKADDPPITPENLTGIVDDLQNVEELQNVSPQALDFLRLLLAFDPR